MCYTVIAGDISGDDAAAACVTAGGSLASIPDDSTNEEIADLCDDAVDGKGYCWIGLHDDDDDGTYVWSGALVWGNVGIMRARAYCML